LGPMVVLGGGRFLLSKVPLYARVMSESTRVIDYFRAQAERCMCASQCEHPIGEKRGRLVLLRQLSFVVTVLMNFQILMRGARGRSERKRQYQPSEVNLTVFIFSVDLRSRKTINPVCSAFAKQTYISNLHTLRFTTISSVPVR
jgi:hypothetical protein